MKEEQRFARRFGCTVSVEFRHMFRGSKDLNGEVDGRGPCGCHLGASWCTFANWMKRSGRDTWRLDEWIRVNAQAKREADERFDELTEKAIESSWTLKDFVCKYRRWELTPRELERKE